MSTAIASGPEPAIVYPDSDGQPMAENTKQFRYIVTIQGNLALQERDNPNCFVAGDNLIYPVQGHPEITMAPDVYVAFGRPKGDRGSYKVWEEGGIFPQVIFEVLSPSNRPPEMARKFAFYEEHGAQEYYIYDPDRNLLEGYLRDPAGNVLVEIPRMHGHVSPLLGIRFQLTDDSLELFGRDGAKFLTFEELGAERKNEALRAEAEKKRAESEKKRAESERQKAETQKQRADIEKQRADAEKKRAESEKNRADDAERLAGILRAKLKALGVDPDLNGSSP